MEKTIKIGFIGLGEHQSRAHIKHLLTLQERGENIELVAAFDVDPEAFARVKESYGLEFTQFDSAEALVESGGLDAVFISSPDEFHTEQLTLALEAGLHVFCEKPITVSNLDAKMLPYLLENASKRGLIVSTCHPRRYDPPFLHIKRMLPQFVEEYGELIHFDFSFWYHEVTDPWKRDRSLLSDHYGHEIDILAFLCGLKNFNATKNADAFDGYEVTGTSETIQSFRFLGSRALKEKEYRESVRLDFRKGSLFFGLNDGTGFELPTGRMFSFPVIDYDERFLAVNRNFIAAIRGNETPYVTHEDILRNNLTSVTLTDSGRVTWVQSCLSSTY